MNCTFLRELSNYLPGSKRDTKSDIISKKAFLRNFIRNGLSPPPLLPDEDLGLSQDDFPDPLGLLKKLANKPSPKLEFQATLNDVINAIKHKAIFGPVPKGFHEGLLFKRRLMSPPIFTLLQKDKIC